MILCDGVVHGYNWTPENWAVPEAAMGAAAGAGFHSFLTPDDSTRLSQEEFLRDWKPEELEEILFAESPLDLVAHHGTPIWDFFKDGHSDTEKGFELKKKNPNRVLVYGAANPFEGDKALRDLEELADRGADAIKVYAARYQEGRTYEQRLDDPEFGYPFIQKALDLGIKVIATHKAMPFGPVRSAPYGVQDLPEACSIFPEMTFEVVHTGFAFVEDTAFLAALPNCWFNLEAAVSLIYNAPRRFAEFIGLFMQSGAADRIVFASGCTLAHPRPLIEKLLEFEMPEDLVEGFGYPQMTDEIKRGILGENYLRMHGIDKDSFLASIEDDQWSQRQQAGLAEPWSHHRERLHAVA
jgi:predicted TIM-barrel fold metal-dependent hydrolase